MLFFFSNGKDPMDKIICYDFTILCRVFCSKDHERAYMVAPEVADSKLFHGPFNYF